MIGRLVAWLWEIQGLTCREAVRLSAKAMESSLTLAERAKLSLHYLLCKRCQAYARQLRYLRKWLRKMDGGGWTTGTAMSRTVTLRIKRRLEKETSQQERLVRAEERRPGSSFEK
jgi:hypothetical protein